MTFPLPNVNQEQREEFWTDAIYELQEVYERIITSLWWRAFCGAANDLVPCVRKEPQQLEDDLIITSLPLSVSSPSCELDNFKGGSSKTPLEKALDLTLEIYSSYIFLQLLSFREQRFLAFCVSLCLSPWAVS